MIPRTATLQDVDHIAAMHVQCWQDTYVGLLPDAEIAKRDIAYRRRLWSKMLNEKKTTIALIDQVGFAQVGPQRDTTLHDLYPRELYALYILKRTYGTGAGQALFRYVIDQAAGGFSTLVLKGNARATAFYRKSGGCLLKEVTDPDGYTDLAFGWAEPAALVS